jgi:hypothetical protein
MPFANYKDFDDCVRKNSDKEDPKAYCGKIQAAAEGEVMGDFQVRTTIRTRLDESAVFEEADGKMMATIRILKAGTSKNRRTYPPAVVKAAYESKLFDGAPMFVDHDRKRAEPGQRSFNEMMSVVESTTFDDVSQSLIGRVRFFDRPFYEKTQEAREHVGVSINALVRGDRKVVAGEVHEDVTGWGRGRSVDWVINPAAGGQILAFEDEDVESMIDWSKVTADDIKKNAAAVYESIQKDAVGSADEHKDDPPAKDAPAVSAADIQKAVQEAIDAERKAAEAKAEKQRTAANSIREAFSKSGLPQRTQARVMHAFEGVEEYDEKQVNAAIEDAKAELQEVGAGPHIRGMGPSGGGSSDKTQKEVTFSAHESVRTSLIGAPAKKEAKEE